MTTSTADQRFGKSERLRQRHEFKRTQRKGTRRSGTHLVVYAAANALDCTRLGLTVSRKVGNATRRNRWKRRLREIFRRNKDEVPQGYDVVVIVKKSAPSEPRFDTLRRELLTLIGEAVARHG